MHEYIKMLKEMIPNVNIDETHDKINQDPKLCPEGDLFDHPSAMSTTVAAQIYEEQEKKINGVTGNFLNLDIR